MMTWRGWLIWFLLVILTMTAIGINSYANRDRDCSPRIVGKVVWYHCENPVAMATPNN